MWEGETEGGHYQIVDTLYDGRAARVLYSLDPQTAQSGVATDGKPDLLFEYNQCFFELASSLLPKTVLIIGGGVGTLATALLAALPDVHIVMVEPDADLAGLAYRYFDLPRDKRLQIEHADGLSWLQQHDTCFDIIFVDAFTNEQIPRELQTAEAFQAYVKHVQPGGVIAMNVISTYHGLQSKVLRALCRAAGQTFSQLDLIVAGEGYSLWLPQNFVLLGQTTTRRRLADYTRGKAMELPAI